jgi:hypothetical protein
MPVLCILIVSEKIFTFNSSIFAVYMVYCMKTIERELKNPVKNYKKEEE